MGVDQTSLDRIRNATFPSARRGYDKHEVEKFLARLADWLETGAGDESRSDTVKRELERVGQRTGAILAQAEESAQQIRSEAEEEARETIHKANAQAEQARSEADAYSDEARAEAEREARETIETAEAKAERIVEEGARRREDVEAVIADLVRRRDEVLADTEELSARLTAAMREHRPNAGADPFDKPDELDPLEQEPGDDLDAQLGFTDQAEDDEEEAPAEQPASKPEAGRRSTRRVQA